MILIAESGSSKTDWIGYTPEKNYTFNTVGMNPYFYTAEAVSKIMREAEGFKTIAPQVKEVYFYGSGCYTTDKHEIISNGLSAVFKNAYICVESDINAAAYATCGNEEGFCCILGTGSNISYFDGESIFAGKHGLGYVLGDEGSGTYFGKQVLLNYLNGKFPPYLMAQFKAKYPQLNKESVLESLYSQPMPNRFLAAFSPFMSAHIHHPYIIQMLCDGFQEFVDTNVKSYQNYKEIHCNFVGSIAWFYQEYLKQVCQKNQITVGRIIQKPIDGLVQYILKKEGYLS